METNADDIHESMWQSVGQFASLMASQGLRQGWGFGFVYGVCVGFFCLWGIGAAFGGPIGLVIGTVAGTILGRVSGFIQGLVTVWYARRQGDPVPMADINRDWQWQRLFVWTGAIVTLIGSFLITIIVSRLIGSQQEQGMIEFYLWWGFVPSLLAMWAAVRGSRHVIEILNQGALEVGLENEQRLQSLDQGRII